MPHETEQDRINQRNILTTLTEMIRRDGFDWHFAQFPSLSKLDASFMDQNDKILVLAEVKQRAIASTLYRDIPIERTKYAYGVDAVSSLSVAFYIGIRCTDCDLWWRWTPDLHSHVRYGRMTRKNPRDDHDVDDRVVYVPVDAARRRYNHPCGTINRVAPLPRITRAAMIKPSATRPRNDGSET